VGTASEVRTDFTYDTAGNLATRLDAANDTSIDVTTTYAYNPFGQVTDKTEASGTSIAVVTRYDYDRDGQIDEIATYQSGVLTEKDQATSMARKLDTWDFYQAGALTRSERDSNGDGIIDQWWEYTRPGCPMIHSDVNNDGKPDPGATVDYCKETGYVPPERQGPAAPQSPDFGKATLAPTEVENKATDEAAKPNNDAAKPNNGKGPSK